ncbi:MAG TPA: AAA family ATPase [Paracoccaceae bacterium]|nr:AAA family ATPase [Paracoccaceae bacterium]
MSDSGKKRASSPKIIAIANQKGGVGKTTTAINLGTALAEAGLQCLIIDLDPQGNASTGLGSIFSDRVNTSYDVLTDQVSLADATVETPVSGLYLVPASVDLSGVDVELVEDRQRARRLRSLLTSDIRDRYDYILIDCPPSLNLLTVNAMVAASGVVVPLQCEFFALEGLSQLISTIRRVQSSLNPTLKIHGIVLTMYDRRNRLSLQVAEDVRENLGSVVYDTVIPRNVRVSEAPSHAIPALLYDPSCAGSQAYRALARELLNRDRATEAA